MATLRDIMAYFCLHYPHKGELSRARLTKMVYLADWKNAIDKGAQLTDIHWYFDNYGPFVWDIWKTAQSQTSAFKIQATLNMFSDEKNLIDISDGAVPPSLSADEQRILRHVIDSTKDLSWQSFIKLVYSTYPVLSSERYSNLDIVSKAQEYTTSRSKGEYSP